MHIKQYLTYNPCTGIFIWKARSNKSFNTMYADKEAGGIEDGYRVIVIKGQKYQAHKLAWMLCYGIQTKPLIDHIDGNPLNNSIWNLREATYSQNVINSKLNSKNTSGHAGVHFNVYNRWIASIHINNKPFRLGSFTTKEEAVAVRKEAELKYYREFIRR